jgi:hypothetical protein
VSTAPETFQPSPIDPATQQQPDPTALAVQGESVPAVVDIDDAEFNAALAEVKAEETGAAQQTTGAGTTQAAPQTTAPKEPPAPAPMIPKPRFDEVNSRAEKLATENAYLKGQLDARTAPAPAAATQTQPLAPTPEQHLAAIANATDALAKRFDDGEITMAEFKREERQLEAQAHSIREQQTLTKARPAATVDAGNEGNELYLETLTAQLETQHPWVEVFDKVGTPSDWEYLKTRARENLTERGIDLSKKTAVGTYELRKEVSRLADELGPTLVAAKATAKGIALPGTQAQSQTTTTQQQAKPLSPTAQARQAALDKAANAPPNLNALHGHTGNEGGIPTDAAIEAMSEDDIAKLPQAVRNKMLGIGV